MGFIFAFRQQNFSNAARIYFAIFESANRSTGYALPPDERITENNFKMLSQKYQAEQQETEEKIARLKASMAEEKQTVADTEKWINLIRQYAAPTELTADLLNTLIE